MSEHVQKSHIPGRPTIVLTGPQGCGKTLFSKALAIKLNCSHVVDGQPAPTDGALVIGSDGGGGDLTITVHTQDGFNALLRPLRIPLSHRPPYATESVPGPGPELQWGS